MASRTGRHSQNRPAADETSAEKRRFPPKIKVLIIILSVLAVVLAGVGVGIYYFYDHIVRRPEAAFIDAPKPIETQDQEAYKPSAVESIIDLGDLKSTKPVEVEVEKVTQTTTAARTEEKDITDQKLVNIALIGIDCDKDGKTTSGTEVHADVCMILTIDFQTGKVDLTTIPRDTLTTTPGYYGYYKFNGTFNVGGGMENPEGGFEQVCRTAEYWCGGISIPYYYAVNFEGVKGLVDAIGGIDYDVDQGFWDHNKRWYRTGQQHLDGEAVLGYLRVRRHADGTDRSRTARQRRMMVAIFRKLKNEGKLSMVPSLLSAVKNDVWTNTNMTQTAALAYYASKIDPESIGTNVLDGKIHMTYDWAFSFVSQPGRQNVLKKVWGIEAKPVGVCTRHYEFWLHNGGFITFKYIRQA